MKFKIKDIIWLIKFLWNYNSMDADYGFKFLHWHITNLLELSIKCKHRYTTQDKREKEMKVFLELLKREIDENFGDITKIGYKQYITREKENLDMLCKYIRNYKRWWI